MSNFSDSYQDFWLTLYLSLYALLKSLSHNFLTEKKTNVWIAATTWIEQQNEKGEPYFFIEYRVIQKFCDIFCFSYISVQESDKPLIFFKRCVVKFSSNLYLSVFRTKDLESCTSHILQSHEVHLLPTHFFVTFSTSYRPY